MSVRKTISPVLADLSQDIAGPIPVDLILLWNSRDKTLAHHKKLLAPYEKRGTLVSSDSAGLSKLTASRPLLTVMKLVSDPKVVIYQYGKAIGGVPVGLWIADNTEMFYDEKISPAQIVDHMIAAQREIAQLTVQVGIGMHTATFWEIGGGMYGDEANKIEDVTENYIEGKDLLLSKTVKPHLQKSYQKKLTPHPDFPWSFFLKYDEFSVVSKKSADVHYPYPFTQAFFTDISAANLENEKEYQKIYARFGSDKVIILINVHHRKRSLLLDELTDRIIASALIKKVAADYHVQWVSGGGDIGIFMTIDAEEAKQFSQSVRQSLKQQKFATTIGISKGSVLLFPMEKGGLQIAGGPVNIASKLAEDVGKPGNIYIENSVRLKTGEKFTFEVSHVKISGVKI